MKYAIVLILLLSASFLGIQFISQARASTPRILLLNLGTPEGPGALQLLNMSFVSVDSTAFMTVDLNQYDVLFVGWDGTTSNPAPFNALLSRQTDIANWVAAGHSVVALAEPNIGHFAWLPLSVTMVPQFGDAVHITNPSHPVMANLTDALLSNWFSSLHNVFTAWNPAYQVLATNPTFSVPITLVAALGAGRIAITGQDPDWHLFYRGQPGAAILLRNMINWAGGASHGVTGGVASIAVNPTVTTATKGSSFSDVVNITNVTNLYSIDVFLTFDSTILGAAVPNDTGNVLHAYCSKTAGCSGVSSSLTTGTGFVEVKESLVGMVQGFTGNGTLFTVLFAAAKTSTGTSVMHIASSSTGTGNGIIVTGTGQQIRHYSVDGVFSDNGPDLFLSAVPNVIILSQGGSASSRVTIYSLSGLTGTLTLSLSGVPTGVTASLNQTLISLTGASASTTLSVTVSSTAVAGNFTIIILGSAAVKSGTITRTAGLSLTVLPVKPDFSISLSPSSINIPVGGSGGLTVSLTSINGFTGPTTLSVQGLPTFGGITTSFSINPVTPPSGGVATSTLTLIVSSGIFPGTIPLTLTASSASVTHTSSFTLAVSAFAIQAAPPFPPFPVVTLQPGQTVALPLEAVSINGFAGNVKLGTVFVPNNITLTLSTTTVTVTPSSISPFTAFIQDNQAAPGDLTTFVTGTSGPTIAVAPIGLQITDYSMALPTSAVSLPVTGSTSTGVFISSLNGFSGPVNLQVTGAPPGIVATITPNIISVGPGNTTSAKVTITATSSATAGTFSLTITATNGPTTRLAVLAVRVTDFSLSVSAPSLAVSGGQSASLVLTVTPINGFSLPVDLTISGLPTGVTATIVPSTVATTSGAATAFLNLTVSRKPLLGTFTVIITATSGSLNHTITLTLTVSK